MSTASTFQVDKHICCWKLSLTKSICFRVGAWGLKLLSNRNRVMKEKKRQKHKTAWKGTFSKLWICLIYFSHGYGFHSKRGEGDNRLYYYDIWNRHEFWIRSTSIPKIHSRSESLICSHKCCQQLWGSNN